MFFAAAFFAALLFLLGVSDDEGLRLARRFIQPAKGRLRALRSWGLDAAASAVVAMVAQPIILL